MSSSTNRLASEFTIDKTSAKGLFSSSFAQKRLLALLGGVALSLALLIAGISWQSHENVIAEARTTAKNLVSALDQHTARTVEAVDLALKIVQQRLESGFDMPGEQIPLHGMLKEIADSSPQIRSMVVLDQNGRSILDSSSINARPVNSEDRDFFTIQRDNKNQGIFLTSTFRNRINNQWTIIASRRINAKDGSFAGTVVAAISPDYFRSFYDQIDVGKEGAVNLISTSGSVVIRRPWNDETVGQDVRNSQLFQTYLPKGPSGLYEGQSTVDGISRIFAYKKQDNLPLISVVGISKAEILTNWRRQTSVILIAAIVISAFVGLLAVILTRALHRLRLSEMNAARNAELMKTTFDNMDQGLILVDQNQRVALYNRRMPALLDLPETVLSGKPFLKDIVEYQISIGEFREASQELQKLVEDRGASSDYLNFERTRPNGISLEIRTVPMDTGGFVRTYSDVTARKSSERAQAESDLRHQTILDTAHHAFISMDAEGSISAWNLAAERIFGWPSDAVIGRSLHDTIVPSAFRHAYLTGMEHHLLTGDSEILGKRLEMSALRSDGTEFPVELTISMTSQAGVPSFHAFVQDISDRKQREAEIAESEARYRLLAENASDLIILTSQFGDRLYVSPAVRLMLGYEPDEFAAIRRQDLIHPDDFMRVKDVYNRLGPDCEKVVSTHRVKHNAGHFVWVEAVFTWTHARSDRGEPTVIGAFRDISDRQLAEQAWIDSESRYKLLAETTSDVITRLDLDFRRVYVSPACRNLFGYEPEEMLGGQPSASVHPDDAQAVRELAESLVAGRVPSDRGTVTYRALHKRGHWVWIEAVVDLVRDPMTGLPSSLVCALRDVSVRQEQANDLEAAKDEAENAARVKTEFLASMSHELRTPLNSIIGFSGLMLRSGELKSPIMEHYARLVEGASMTLLSIVNDVLDVSKLESGGFELDAHPFDIRSLVEDAVELMLHEAEAKGLLLKLQCDTDIPDALLGDANRLRQVLLNLISNAIKFTANGEVNISVTMCGSASAHCRLAFAVQDTGIGIPIEKQHRLFQRFSQVDGSTARQFGGTGLGLSICKSLIELMGGAISVRSAAGQGATFSFELTLARATLSVESEKSDVKAVTEGAFILLAEDVPMNQELAVALLTQRGHRIEVVADGAAAVDAVMRTTYDLVLMDVQMPVMDGVEATRRIRALGGPHIALPIIAMTANVLPDDVARFQAAGMNDHVGKPFKHGDLCDIVARWSIDNRHRFDQATFDKLSLTISPSTAKRLIGMFQAEIAVTLGLNADDSTIRRQIAARAHRIASTAGVLGFVGLSLKCRQMDEMADGDSDLTILLGEIEFERNKALAIAQDIMSQPIVDLQASAIA